MTEPYLKGKRNKKKELTKAQSLIPKCPDYRFLSTQVPIFLFTWPDLSKNRTRYKELTVRPK